MAFAFVESNTITTYPVSASDVRARFPNVSFPSNLNSLSAADLAEYGVVSVVDEPRPSYDEKTQTLAEGAPVLNAGVWRQTWNISSLSAELIATKLALREHTQRTRRDQELDSCDWVVTMHKELGTEIPSAWLTYRQALRDLPAQAGFPDSITWPTKPS